MLLLLLTLVSVVGCAVPRATAPSLQTLDSTTLPNLRRAQEALQDLLAREREHVGALNLKIATLRAEEAHLNEQYLDREYDYLLLEDDLASVEEEILAVQTEIQAAREALKAAGAQLKALESKLAGIQAQQIDIDVVIAALLHMVEKGHVALASLPPMLRALVDQELARVATLRELELEATGTRQGELDPPDVEAEHGANAGTEDEDGESGGN